MIWRDDDIIYPHAQLEHLLEVDDILQAHDCVHTIAIIAETLTPELGALIRARGMVPQLHAWAHDDLSENVAAIAQLPMALDRIHALCGDRPTVLYPPWNRSNPRLESVARALGLSVSVDKLSLEQIVRHGGVVDPKATVNFHFWHAPDRAILPEAVKVYCAARAA